ncbi:MAG: membrane-bound lytic murein transglycosylase MltF [Gammaproteobacteria bacterium]|nr:MAG: membrane-bound lytic murein transglycosylase MltF [Gammaproteobacteria bacterium]RLA60519.1 MAG: membrane-bound lytic murein transglycosylase MltF [Gammaproteobacteria bacterium]
MTPRIIIVTLVLLCLPGGCAKEDALDSILSRGELLVVSRNSPTTYYLDKSGPTGFEYALAGLLAEDLGVQLNMQPVFSLTGIFEKLQREEADFAAAGLTLTRQRESTYPHSVAYYQLKPQVVYVAGMFRPHSVADLAGMTILVLTGSSHAESLRALQQSGFSDLQWQEIPEVDSMELLERVNEGYADLAIIDSNEFTVQQSLYPRLKVAFDLATEQDMVWYLPPTTDNIRLLGRIDNFIRAMVEDGSLGRLREEYFGHTYGVSRINSHTFIRNMKKSLPPYRALIRQVAKEYQLDWHLLAAIAYQESHWHPQAASPTGVRGMMMLTLPTAEEMGVDNRLDAGQSLRGGARYLKNIKRRLPHDIYEPDRTWLALAAYNIGMGHLEDARVITDRQGGDPHLWRDVMQRLPLLQKSKYFQSVRYGYARGLEAATYVQNIRHYYSILQWQDIPDNKVQPPLRTEDYLPAALHNLDLLAL